MAALGETAYNNIEDVEEVWAPWMYSYDILNKGLGKRGLKCQIINKGQGTRGSHVHFMEVVLRTTWLDQT